MLIIYWSRIHCSIILSKQQSRHMQCLNSEVVKFYMQIMHDVLQRSHRVCPHTSLLCWLCLSLVRNFHNFNNRFFNTPSLCRIAYSAATVSYIVTMQHYIMRHSCNSEVTNRYMAQYMYMHLTTPTHRALMQSYKCCLLGSSI